MSMLTLERDLPALRERLGVPHTWVVACLCAEWCDVCRTYRSTFAAVADKYPQCCFVWVDVENCAAAVEALEIENFPTLLMQRDAHTVFLGTVLPHADVLERLVRRDLEGLPTIGHAPDVREWLASLCQHVSE